MFGAKGRDDDARSRGENRSRRISEWTIPEKKCVSSLRRVQAGKRGAESQVEGKERENSSAGMLDSDN